MSYKFSSIPKKSLYQSILSTSSTFKLSDIVGFDGNDLTASDFGSVAYGVILNSDKTQMELFSFDPATIASSSISFVYRGLQFDGNLTTEVTANKLDWSSGSTVLIGTDSPQALQWLKEYIESIAIAGSPDASTTVKGIVEEATQAEVDAGTATGGTSARLFQNPSTIRAKKYHDYIADAGSNDNYAITVVPAITAYATGQEFTFKANTANTGACTLNVCGLGAKTIKKNVNDDLATGDILQNQIVKVQYDGTNMQLISVVSGAKDATKLTGLLPKANGGRNTATPFTLGATTYDLSTASGAQNIAHGLGQIPSKVKISAYFPSSRNLSIAMTTYTGSTQASIYSSNRTDTTTVEAGTSFKIPLEAGDASYVTGVVTTDATNIIITWTKTGSPTGTVNLMWEAEM